MIERNSDHSACSSRPDGTHQWLALALGRICLACRVVQVKDEYAGDGVAAGDTVTTARDGGPPAAEPPATGATAEDIGDV